MYNSHCNVSILIVNQMLTLVFFFDQSGRQIVGGEGERVVSRGQNGRPVINGRKDKVE